MVSLVYMQVEGGWGVIFRPHASAVEEECMLLSIHKDERFAKRYAEQFNDTLRAAFRETRQ